MTPSAWVITFNITVYAPGVHAARNSNATLLAGKLIRQGVAL